MNIQPCTITTTETKTREMFTPAPDVAGTVLCCYENQATGYRPVTLTYPASVQVPGWRIDATDAELDDEIGLLNAIRKARGKEAVVSLIDINAAVENAAKLSDHWYVAEIADKPDSQPQPARVPYTNETWPMGALVRQRGGTSRAVLYNYANGVSCMGAFFTWEQLAADYELSTDGGKTWQPCYQPHPAADKLVTESGEWEWIERGRTERWAKQIDGVWYCVWKYAPNDMWSAGDGDDMGNAVAFRKCGGTLRTRELAARACEDYARERRQANKWVPVGVRVPTSGNDVVARTADGQEGRAWWYAEAKRWRLRTDDRVADWANDMGLTVTAWREIRPGETVGYFAAKGGA